MLTEKQKAIDLINKLPDNFTTEEILAELHFKHQVELGLKDAEEGRTYTHNQVKDMVMQWRKSSGREFAKLH